MFRSIATRALFGLTLLLAACGSDGTPDATGAAGAAGGAKNGGPAAFANGASTPTSNGDATCAATTAEVGKAKVDLIFAIDNSGSMTEEIVQVQENVNRFAQKILQSGLDLQVIFITARRGAPPGNDPFGLGGFGSDENAICVPAPLGGPGCADNAPAFRHLPQTVSSSDSLELLLALYDGAVGAPGLESIEAPLVPGLTPYRDLLRFDAWKVFVEVTDDESSLDATAFDQQLLAKTPAGMFGTAASRRYVFHSIVGWKEGTAPLSTEQCASADGAGVQYRTLSQMTGGLIESVCKTDYASVLDRLAEGTSARLACDLSVPAGVSADPTTLVVRYSPANGAARTLTQVTDASKCDANPDGWHYDDNAKPTRVILCPSTCTSTGKEGGKIDALVGCKAPAPR